MAVSIEIGPIECKNKPCIDSLENQLMSVNFFSKEDSVKQEGIKILQYLINTFPTHNFPKRLGKAYWKSIYLIIFELPMSPPCLLGKVLSYLSNSELFAYFSDLESIFRSYLEKKTSISFKPENLRNAEAQVNLELSGPAKTSISSNKDPSDYFMKQVSREESSLRINLLILSLKYVKSMIFLYPNKQILLNLIKSLLNCDDVKHSCQQFLLGLDEFKLRDIEKFENIQSSDIQHLSRTFIVETTKSMLADGRQVGSLTKFSIEIMKHGVKLTDAANIEKIVKNPELHVFAWHYIRCYLSEDFEKFIQVVSAWVEKVENNIKKAKNPLFEKHQLRITNSEAIESLDFGQIIIEAVSTQNKVILSFLRGLTALEIFKLKEDTKDINNFFTFTGFKPATTLNQIIDLFIRDKEAAAIPKPLTFDSLIEIYQTLSLLPIQILQASSQEAQNYLKIIIKQLSSDKIFLQQEYSSLGSSFQHLYSCTIRAMIRTIQVICNELDMKSMKHVKVYVGFEFSCPLCGNVCKDFCEFCYSRKIPVVLPVVNEDFVPDFEVTLVKAYEIKTTPAKNSFSEDLQKILKTSLKIIQSARDNHDCLKTLACFKYIFSCNFLIQFSDLIDFELDPSSASLIQPLSLMFPKFKIFLRENLLTGKKIALRMLESGILPSLPYSRYVQVVQLVIWPTNSPDLLSITRRCVNFFQLKYGISLQDMLSFIKSKDLCEWAEASTKFIGFIQFLLDLQTFDLEPFLGQIEVELFMKYNSQKVYRVLKRLFKEYKNSAINLFYSSVIVGILWKNREDKLKDLEDLSRLILGKSRDEPVSVKDLFDSQVSENFNQAKIFLICELGLGETLKEWIFVKKTHSEPVIIPDINLNQFFKTFSIIEGIFKEADFISQNVVNLNSFDLTEFFKATSLIDTVELHDKLLFFNLILGISRLCFYYNELGENVQYLAAKIIGICGHLLEIDMNIMLQVLERLVNNFNIEFHRSAVLALAFIGREHIRGQKIIETVLSSISYDSLNGMSELFFMLLYKESNCLDPLRKSFESKYGDTINLCFLSLSNSLCMNFPLVQYAALTLIPYIVKSKLQIPYLKLILALNKANSMLSARHHTGELPFSLGMRIDTCIGIVGAYYCLEPIENTYKYPLSALVTCERFYSNIERLYLSQKMMENNPKNDQIVELLKSLFENNEKVLKELRWKECKSLREWTQHLIDLCHMKELYPVIPLIQVNLDTLIYTLPEIFSKNPDKHDYFVCYLTDFFENGPATYRRLMLKVIDKCPSLKCKLPITQMMNQYLDLNEYPRALQLLETRIRDRISSLNKRYDPSLITTEELELCKKVFHGLHSWKFLNSIPEVCKTSLDEQKLDKSNFKAGFYSHLFLYKTNHLLSVAASWRIGQPADVSLCTDIEVCLAYILKSNSKEEAARDVRNFLIRTSAIRIADFCQAYEHILLQHLIENILGITQGKYSFQEIRERNKVIQDKFIYKEMALRVSYVLYKQVENIRLFIASIYDIFKLGFLYEDYKYCQNFLDDLEVCNRFQIRYPLLYRYLSSKLLLLTNRIDRKSLESLENLWEYIPVNNEIPEKLGFFSNIRFKYKVGVLIIRFLILLSKTLENVEDIQEKYLKPIEEHYGEIRLSLEKGFSILADHLYNSVFLENGNINRRTAEKVCFLYILSLRHGHNLYSNSSTRLLLLFFILTQEPLNCKELLDNMIDLATNLPLFIWADRVNQLVSSSNTTSKEARLVISIVFIRLLEAHHSHMLWLIGPYIANADEKSENRSIFLRQVYKNYCSKFNALTSVEQLKDFFDPLIRLSNQLKCTKVPITRPSIEIVFPSRQNFSVISYPKTENLWGKNLPGFTQSPLLITEFEPVCERMTSKSRPAKVVVRCSDGSKRILICKFDKDCDMRKESRVSQIIEYMNKVFSKDPECKRLYIRLMSYSIMYIGKNCVVVEWVNETATIKSVIHSCNPTGVSFSGEHYEPKIWAVIQERIRPTLHKYFLQQFPEPNDWLIARNKFTNSLAVWSIFGYVIGLGDRHGENIMINKATGELMFIDFECIFNHGLNLPRPEIVPFRLTPELQTAMGLFFEEGDFIKTATKVLACMKKNRISIMIQFESFVIDPLTVRINNPEIDKRDFSPELTLKIVKSRLEGVEKYGSKKIFITNKEQVRYLINLATNSDALRKMYKGWCPWE